MSGRAGELDEGGRRTWPADPLRARGAEGQRTVSRGGGERTGRTTKSIFFLQPERAEARPPLETEKR